MDNLFFKVFRNNYIKFIILNHLKLLNIYSKTRSFHGLESFIKFKKEFIHIQYIRSIEIELIKNDRNLLMSIDNFDEILPNNIISLSINFNLKESNNGIIHSSNSSGGGGGGGGKNNRNSNNIIFDKLPKIPNWIESFKLKNYRIPNNYFDNCNNLKYLELNGTAIDEKKDEDALGVINYLENDGIVGKHYQCNFKLIEPGCIPKSVTNLHIEYFKQPPLIGSIPSNVSVLSFGDSFNLPIRYEVLPSSIQVLKFGKEFNQIIFPGTLPINLKSLTFGDCFNTIIDARALPDSLEVIIFGKEFKENFKIDSLPNNLKYLELGRNWNNNLEGSDILPKKLITLKFSQIRKQISSGIIPVSLENLHLGNLYDHSLGPVQSLDMVNSNSSGNNNSNNNGTASRSGSSSGLDIKSKISNLLFTSKKKKNDNNSASKIKNFKYQDPSLYLLPQCSNLRNLEFGECFNKSINIGDLLMCKYLTSITFGIKFNQTLIPNSFPPSVTSLVFQSFNNGDKILENGSLPPNLEYLDLSYAFNQSLQAGVLGDRLKVLILGKNFQKSIGNGVLPNKLELLEFIDCEGIKEIGSKAITNKSTIVKYKTTTFFKFKSIPKCLEKYITHLEFGSLSDSDQIHQIPSSLTNLVCLKYTYSSAYSKFDVNSFPISLTSLTFPNSYNLQFDGCLKNLINLTTLEFGDQFNQLLEIGIPGDNDQIPKSIKVLKVGMNFNQVVSSNIFPLLEKLVVDKGNPILYDYQLDFKYLKSIICNNSNFNFLESLDFNKYSQYLEMVK